MKQLVVKVLLAVQKRYQVDAGLAKHLKPHQWEGVRFIWRNLVESFEVCHYFCTSSAISVT